MLTWFANLPVALRKRTHDRLFESRKPVVESLEDRCVPDANGNFVSATYLALLGRPADSTGLTVFTNALDNNQLSRLQVVQEIQTSPEYQQHIVNQLYQQLLGRPADQSGLQAWTNFLAQGNTQLQLEAQILGSQEYYQKNGGTDQDFLTAIYNDVLHRPIDSSGQQSFTTALNNGVSRTQVALILLESPEATTDFVQAQYQTLLHRTADTNGESGWVNAIEQNNHTASTNGSNSNGSNSNGSHGGFTNNAAIYGSANEQGLTQEQVTAHIIASQEFFDNAQITTTGTGTGTGGTGGTGT